MKLLQKRIYWLLGFFLLVSVSLFVLSVQKNQEMRSRAAGTVPFIASIDTMKESKDTAQNQLTPAQIATDVNLAAQQNVTHITVDVFYDYPAYMKSWIDAIRATGKNVWFRAQFNCWELQNNCTTQMLPADYTIALKSFITAHPDFFKSGDIFDPLPEPENSTYWPNKYGTNWSWQPTAPNAATDEFNTFMLALTDAANQTFQANGITGVTTGIRSVSPWWGKTPSSLYPATVSKLGYITIDTYPEGTTTDPTTAASALVNEINQVTSSFPGIPLVIGEHGYSNNVAVDDITQQNVLKAEYDAISGNTNIVGYNYWVGAGGASAGGFTNIFTGSRGSWTARPAAKTVADYFLRKKGTVTQSPTSVPPTGVLLTPTIVPTMVTPTLYCLGSCSNGPTVTQPVLPSETVIPSSTVSVTISPTNAVVPTDTVVPSYNPSPTQDLIPTQTLSPSPTIVQPITGHNKSPNGYLQALIMFLLQFLMQLFQYLHF